MNVTKSDIIAILRKLASSDITAIPSANCETNGDQTNGDQTNGDQTNGDQTNGTSNSNMTVKNPQREDQTGQKLTQKEKYPFIVSLEGNIGAGKSTIIDVLRQKYETEPEKYFGKLAKEQIVFMQEPVDVWTSVCDSVTGESILKKFYRDPKTYAFAFQVMVYNTHLEAFRRVVRENPDCVLLICERSIDAGRHIFTKMLCDDGMIDNVCFQVYKNLFDSTANEFSLDAVLYLDVAPEICLERIGIRARDGEGGIPLEYLQRCHQYYEKWLSGI